MRILDLVSSIVLVHVGSTDGKDTLRVNSEVKWPASAMQQDGSSDLAKELDVQPSDHVVLKHQWGAFYGTDLDLQLRRRGINTIVLCGVSTDIGVKTTAREEYQNGYDQVFAEDAMAAMSKEEHDHTLKFIFPRIGIIRKTAEILEMMK